MTKNGIARFLKQNAPTILTFLGTVGVVGTAVAVAMETPKAEKDLEECKDDDVLTKAIVITKDYLPAIGIGAATITCIVSSNILNQKQQASIISAYMGVNEVFKQYRNQVKERYGDEVDEEMLNNCVGYASYYHELHVEHPDVMALWYEPYTKTYLRAYEREILHAEYHTNRNFMLGGYISVADWARMLGVPEDKICTYHEDEGWSTFDEYYWFDVTHNYIGRDKKTGLPVFELCTDFCPSDRYLEGYM